MVERATKTAASKSNSRLLRVDGVAGAVEMPLWAEFGDFPKAKPNVCVFSPPNDSAIHLYLY